MCLILCLVIHITRDVTRHKVEQMHKLHNTSYTQIHKCILVVAVIFLFMSSSCLVLCLLLFTVMYPYV